MLDQNALRLDAVHPEARKNQAVMLPPPPNSSKANVFAAAILDDTITHRRRPLDLAISLLFHAGLLTVVLLLPLFFSSKLDVHVAAATFLVAPLPPRAAPPPPPAAMSQAPRTPPKATFTPGKLTAPSFVPKKVAVSADDVAPPPDQVMGGMMGGLPGGIAGGGPVEGFLNVAASVPAAPPQPVAEGPKKPIRVGSLTAPRMIYGPQPDYPILARQAHVSGTVVIEAIIDERGNVVEARIVSGPPLLVAAALKAVTLRKYEPTIQDGEPTPVSLRVEVNFHG